MRTIRRHHDARLKAKRKKQRTYKDPAHGLVEPTAREVGRSACTPKACGCALCTSPRRTFNEGPPAEQRQLIKSRHDLKELECQD